MGSYYNKGRTPTSATTSSGQTVCFSPRKWQFVPMADESSASIQALVRKGFLARRDDARDHVVAEGETIAVVVPVPAPFVVLAPLPPIVSEPSPNFEVPSEIEKEDDADVALGDASGTESTSRSRSSRRR